ncbi:hypothetical protein [Pseudomonas sp. B329]|uniref:hypothetical protein n=1 Tax=Pseudomonas sp. B329 TaxID=1553459 RepID=UPI0020037427|nr:hypothetical protein [Pseudomonas sp. B329]MCK3865698.1 hypothetical protein [Pseudomonas sp. B329]
MQPPVLSSADRQRLEAMLRSPQMLEGAPRAIVDESLKRAVQVLEQSKTNEQAIRQAAQQSEAAVRQALNGAPDQSVEQLDLKREVNKEIQQLIARIEAARAGPAKS